MNIRTRRTLGISLLAVSILAGIVLQLATGELVTDQQKSRITSDGFLKHSIVITHVVVLKARYAIPLAAIAAAGLLCLVLPARRPPVIRQ